MAALEIRSPSQAQFLYEKCPNTVKIRVNLGLRSKVTFDSEDSQAGMYVKQN